MHCWGIGIVLRLEIEAYPYKIWVHIELCKNLTSEHPLICTKHSKDQIRLEPIPTYISRHLRIQKGTKNCKINSLRRKFNRNKILQNARSMMWYVILVMMQNTTTIVILYDIQKIIFYRIKYKMWNNKQFFCIINIIIVIIILIIFIVCAQTVRNKIKKLFNEANVKV